MRILKIEQETTITFNGAEEIAHIYSAEPRVIRRLDALCAESEEIVLENDYNGAKTYYCPKKWIKFRKPREMSREQREALAERMREMRRKQNGMAE